MSITFLTNEDEKMFAKSINGVKPDPVTGDIVINIPDSGGNADQGGLTATAANLLITILRNGVYSTNQSANITALQNALASGGGVEPDNPDIPDVPDVPDVPVIPGDTEIDITQDGSTLVIVSALSVTQNGTALIIE